MATNRGQANDVQRHMIVRRNMGKNMHRLRNAEKSFSDVIIQTRDGKKLPVHKAVLASSSDYFSTMFSTEMQEKYSVIVEMKNMASNVLETVINFIYDQPIFFSEETIYELTEAAEYLQVADLKTECQKFLLASTKPSNCLKHRAYGKLYNMKAVTDKADEVITDNLDDISKEKKFRELDYDDLQTILQMQLKKILVNKTNSSLLRVSKEVMSRIKLEKSNVPRRIGIIGGPYTSKDVIVFYPDAKKIQHLPQLQFHFEFPVAVRNGDDLYVIDGATSKVISLNLKGRKYKWEEVTTMPQPKRAGFRCAVLNGFIYVAGGESNDTCLSSVIKYDLSNKVWSDVKNMKEKKMKHALVSLEGKLFAIAGWNGKICLKTVEMYDAKSNQWTYVSSLKKERDSLAATVFKRRIYTTGGHHCSLLPIVEMYNPNEDVWMMTKELNDPRFYHGSCVVGGKLYVVGGYGARSIEEYNPDKEEWKICGKLDTDRSLSAVCAM